MSLALFISALILISFAYSVHAVYAQMENIADSIDHEVVMLTHDKSSYYVINESVRPEDAASLARAAASSLRQSVEKLLSDDRVEAAYGLLYARPVPGVMVPGNASDYILAGGGGVLFVVSSGFSGSCINPVMGGGSWYRGVVEVAAAEAGVSTACPEGFLEQVSTYLLGLSDITNETFVSGPAGGATVVTTVATDLPRTVDQVAVITSDEGVFERAVEALIRRLGSPALLVTPGGIAVSLKPGAYVNPASAQATLDRLHSIAGDLREEVGASVVSTHEADTRIRSYQTFESFGRLAMVFGLIPPLLIVLIATNPIAESIILSMRKQVGLIRLRGAGPGMLGREFALTTALTGAAGFIAGAGLTYAVSVAVFGYTGQTIACLTLTDPVILAATAFITGITLFYAVTKSRKVMAELSPAEAIKTTLTPEELLKPLRVGGLGWFSIIVGLYFVITGYLGWSAAAAITGFMTGSSGPPNIGLFILLVILALIEGVLRPFAPILLAYGIAKYVAVYYDRIMDWVARSGVLGELTFVGKGLIGVMRRRVTAILVLTIFTVGVLTQTYVTITANQTLTDSAALTSLGNEYGAYVDLRMNSSRGLSGLTRYLRESGCGAYVAVHGFIRFEGGSLPAFLIIVPDPDALLRNSAWYPHWSRPDPFDTALRRLSGTETMLVSLEPLALGSSRPEVGESIEFSPFYSGAALGVKVVEESDGFPGSGLVSASTPMGVGVAGPVATLPSALVVAGPSMADELEGAGLLTPMLSIRVAVVGADNASVASCIDGIKERAGGLGMVPVGKGYLRADDLRVSVTPFGIIASLQTPSLSVTQSVVLIGLAVAFSVILSWGVTKEVIRVYLLLRVRGASASDIARIGAVKWGLLAAVAVALGLFVGGALGRGAVATSTPGLGLLSLTATASSGLVMPVNLGQGVMSPYIPLEGWAILAGTAAALTLFPLAITVRVFRGAVRERFIEVR